MFLKLANHPALLLDIDRDPEDRQSSLRPDVIDKKNVNIDEFYNIENCGKINVIFFLYLLKFLKSKAKKN
jgi:hypothetical protein